jgi:NADPH:quinone reductase-like Zn-dependent oxidoreductase
MGANYLVFRMLKNKFKLKRIVIMNPNCGGRKMAYLSGHSSAIASTTIYLFSAFSQFSTTIQEVISSSPLIMALSYQINIVDPSHSHLSPTLLSNLSIKETSIPSPGPGSVLVRIRAVGLNFRDLLCLADSPLYPTRTAPGLIPCNDGAGEIVSVGPGSTWKDSIGDTVILLPNRDWIDGDASVVKMENTLGAGTANGTLAQYVVVQDPWILRAPKNLSFEEAAALPGAAGTAMNVLESINIEKGTTVVTQGTGGVSCAVIQVSCYPIINALMLLINKKYAAALGARVIATSSTDEKLQIAKKLGASELINYKATPDWASEVLRLTGGKGADLVCDVGGSGTLEQSVMALRQGGTACLVGFLTMPEPVDVLMTLISQAKSCRFFIRKGRDSADYGIVKGILIFSRTMLSKVVALTEEHDLHPYLGKVYDWEDAPQAFEQLRRQNTVGKIVIKV